MKNRQPSLPLLWLISDARNNARLENTLARLPRGSGLIFRHYHLAPKERRERFRQLQRVARSFGHLVVLAENTVQAQAWHADGAYGSAQRLSRGPKLLRLVTVHSLGELARAHRARADAVLISPVFPTRSHPGAPTLGAVRLKLLAQRSKVPVIALGGMTAHKARGFAIPRWAAIDGLT